MDNQFLEDVIVTALEGGSNYWISGIQCVGKEKGIPISIWVSNCLNEGKAVNIYEDNGQVTALTKDKFEAGYKFWKQDHPDESDDENIDAGDADVILQYALFGELVYG